VATARTGPADRGAGLPPPTRRLAGQEPPQDAARAQGSRDPRIRVGRGRRRAAEPYQSQAHPVIAVDGRLAHGPGTPHLLYQGKSSGLVM